MPEVGEAFAVWIFRPSSLEYAECSGRLSIYVQKAPIRAKTPVVSSISYHPGMDLAKQILGKGNAQTVYGNIQVSGEWIWKQKETIPDVGEHSYPAVFIPEDESHYQRFETEIVLTVTRGIPEIISMPQASAIAYGQPLAKSVLSNGLAQIDGIQVNGTFVWEDGSAMPSLADSQAREYGVIFVPEDTRRYVSVLCGKVRVTVSSEEQGSHDPGKPQLPIKKGQTAAIGKLRYEVVKVGNDGTAEAALAANLGKSKSSVKIPDTVTIDGVVCKVVSVKAKAFYQNKKLRKVTIGKYVTSIKAKAFYGCKKLKSIVIRTKKLKSVGKNAIKGIAPKAKIKAPKTKRASYQRLFRAKTGFKKSMKIR